MSLSVSNRLFNILRVSRPVTTNNLLFQQRNLILTTQQLQAESADSAESTTKPEETEHDKLIAEKLKEIDSLKQQAADFKDKYVRALAENENIMKRNQKFLADAKLYAVQSFSKDLLEISDVLEKATESVPQDEMKTNKPLADLYQGLTMTHTELHKVFVKHGLEKEDPMDQKFDPNFHEAVFQIPVPDKEKGTVAVVQKVGYRLHGRTLRPAICLLYTSPSPRDRG